MDLKNVIQYTKELSILYVEDDIKSQELISSILDSLFETVDIANDGELGLKAYNQYYLKNDKYYDLILSDIEMPRLDGIKLSETILQINPDQHIIIISAYNEKEKLQKLLQLGIDNFLHKPIEFNNFFETFKKSARPIREQNKIKKDLENAHNLNYNLETLLDIISQVAIVSKTDLEGNITYVNDIFCQMSKYSEEELIGQNHNIIRHQDVPSSVFQNMWEEIKAGKVWKGKLKSRAKDGEVFYVNANIIPIFNSKERIKEYVAIRFLSTQEELENAEFGKQVSDHYQESKRRDFNSRRIIDELQEKLLKFKDFDFIEFALKKEKTRTSKCSTQLKSTEDNYKQQEIEFEKFKLSIKEKMSLLLEQNQSSNKINEEYIQNIEKLKNEINTKSDEFNRMLDNNKQRAKELGDFKDLVKHLEKD